MIQIDMEKPDHCLRCPMRGVDDECVLIRGSENFFGWEEQYANCPLQEVEPERKKGKWQLCGNHHLCSECDEWALSVWDDNEDEEVDVLTNFCPNCGCDMREGEQE